MYVECNITVTVASDTQSREPLFKPCAAMSNLGQVCSVCSSSLSCMYEYLAVNYGGYLCTYNSFTLIVAWLNASQGSRDGDRLTRSAGVCSVKCSECSRALDTVFV